MTEFLQATDPSPVEWINPDSDSAVVLTCEHAGRAVPAGLGNLGLTEDELGDHIGWDIGAAAVTRDLATRLGVAAVLQRYSRLVIDCNRPPQALDSMPAQSAGVSIPANQGLTQADRQQRISQVFQPYDDALSVLTGDKPRRCAFSIHSFTPVLAGQRRPWDVGFLYRKDQATSEFLAAELQKLHPQLNIGMNQPYTIDDESDWFVPRYGEALGLRHSLIEIRNDHLRTVQGQQWWAEQLSIIIRRAAA